MTTANPLPSIPNHLAIIMDGNGRWAKMRQRERFYGHIKGARVAKKIIEHCVRRKVSHLTLYTFSEENWGRPQVEVNFLMRLLMKYIVREKLELHKNNISFRCIGQLDKLPTTILSEIVDTQKLTRQNTGMVLTFALSYGGRQEITQAVKNIAELVSQGQLQSEQINEQVISQMMQTSPSPDPDLLVRTSGEWRLSNFLPWQTVYTELFFTDTLWPDFSERELDQAFVAYSQRERRFGKTKGSYALAESSHSPPRN